MRVGRRGFLKGLLGVVLAPVVAIITKKPTRPITATELHYRVFERPKYVDRLRTAGLGTFNSKPDGIALTQAVREYQQTLLTQITNNAFDNLRRPT